jgi:PTH1 family peptidyl-tRNA hydrolase
VKLVVGLGNPGDAYARTRHNVGWQVADRLAGLLAASFTVKKFAAELAEAKCGGERIWIMKPQTFMNHSGEAVGPALKFWKLGPEDLVVVHDDLELDPFRVQLKVGGGHGGHNGLKSINAHVGTPDYARLRVGVGRPPAPVDPADYVLGRFPRADDAQVESSVGWAAEAARLVCEQGAVKAMNQVNRRRDAAGPGRREPA